MINWSKTSRWGSIEKWKNKVNLFSRWVSGRRQIEFRVPIDFVLFYIIFVLVLNFFYEMPRECLFAEKKEIYNIILYTSYSMFRNTSFSFSFSI